MADDVTKSIVKDDTTLTGTQDTTSERSTSGTSCVTQGGADPGKECVFPFKFGTLTYNECAWNYAPDDNSAWCSTLTDSDGNHVNGQGRDSVI